MPGAGPTTLIAQRMRVYVEPAGSYAEDHTGTLGDFVDVPFVEGSAQLTTTQETQNPSHVLQNMLDYQEEVLGKKVWSLTFDLPFYPSGSAVGDGVTASSNSAIHRLLKAVMGGAHLGTGTTVATGGWASSAAGDVAAAAGLSAGGLFGWADSTGFVHTREIESVTSNTVTLKLGLPAAPASGDTVYTGATYYFTQDPDTSLQFIVEGQETEDRFVILGGQGTVTPTLSLDGTIQTLQFQLTGTKWLTANNAAGSGTIDGSALGKATFSNYRPITSQSGRFLVQTVGTATYSGSEVDIQALNVSSGMTKEMITSPNGVEGVVRFRMVRASGTPPAEGSFQTYYTARTNWTARDSKDDKAVYYQNGVSAGGIVAVSLPTVQFTDVQRDGDTIASETVTVKARLDGDTSETSATDLGRSPARFHLG